MDRRRRRISAAGSRTVRDTGKKEVGGERLKSKIQQYCLFCVFAAGIAVGLGMTGNILAPIVFLLLFNIPSLLVKYYGTFLGYKLGSEYVQKI